MLACTYQIDELVMFEINLAFSLDSLRVLIRSTVFLSLCLSSSKSSTRYMSIIAVPSNGGGGKLPRYIEV